jgi:hypothetical protein
MVVSRPPDPVLARRLALVLTAALLLPTLLLLHRGEYARTVADPELYPVGDHAVLELYTRLAAQGAQLLGPYSRFHFHHPGPALFYASVPLYWLAGENPVGLKITALVVNALCLYSVLRVMASAGHAALLSAAVVLAVFLHAFTAVGVLSNWNPRVIVLPFGAAVFAWAAAAAGRSSFLPVATLATSFAVQTHLATAPTLAVTAATALGLVLAAPVRRPLGLPPAPRRPLVASLLVSALIFVVLWLPPFLEEFAPGGGNLTHLLEFSRRVPLRHPSLGTAFRVVAAGTTGFLEAGAASSAATIAAALAQCAGLALAVRQGVRSRIPLLLSLSLLCLVGMAVAVLSVWHIAGRPFPYLVAWLGTLGVATTVAGAWAVLATVQQVTAVQRRGWLRVAAATAAGVLVLTPVASDVLSARRPASPAPARQPYSLQVRRLAVSVGPFLRSTGPKRSLFVVDRHADRSVATGLLLALDKQGVSLGVRPFGPFRFGGRFTPHGTEEALLVLGPSAPTGVDLKRTRLLGEAGGIYAYLYPLRAARLGAF